MPIPLQSVVFDLDIPVFLHLFTRYSSFDKALCSISLISYKRLESNYPVAALSIPPIQPTDVISFHNFRPIWRMKHSKTSRTLVLVFSWFSKVSLKICHLRSDSAQRCVTAIFASSVLVESFVLCDWHQMQLCRRSFRAGHAQRSGERRHISTVVNCNCQS